MQRRIRDSYPRVSGEVVQVEFEISGCAGWGGFVVWDLGGPGSSDIFTLQAVLFFRRYACHNDLA